MSDDDSLRRLVSQDEYETGFGVKEVEDVSEGRIFGLTAGERMIISVILFMAASVLSVLILFATGTFVLR